RHSEGTRGGTAPRQRLRRRSQGQRRVGASHREIGTAGNGVGGLAACAVPPATLFKFHKATLASLPDPSHVFAQHIDLLSHRSVPFSASTGWMRPAVICDVDAFVAPLG